MQATRRASVKTEPLRGFVTRRGSLCSRFACYRAGPSESRILRIRCGSLAEGSRKSTARFRSASRMQLGRELDIAVESTVCTPAQIHIVQADRGRLGELYQSSDELTSRRVTTQLRESSREGQTQPRMPLPRGFINKPQDDHSGTELRSPILTIRCRSCWTDLIKQSRQMRAEYEEFLRKGKNW